MSISSPEWKPARSDRRGRSGYKPNTIRSYERAIRLRYKDSELGALRPSEVRRADVQGFADDLMATFSGRSASNVLNPLQAFYRRAIDREELANELTKGTDLPSGKSKRPRRIVAADEAARLIELLPPEDRPLWATAFYAGLRRGELPALRCEDIDLARNLIHVRKGWDQEEVEIEPKSEAAKRTIPLLAILRDFLDEQLVRTGEAARIASSAAPQIKSSTRPPSTVGRGAHGRRTISPSGRLPRKRSARRAC